MAGQRLVIFDVDGTLVDSQDMIVQALTGAFAAEGLAAPGRAEMLSIVGLSLPQAFGELMPGAGAARVGRLVDAYKATFLELRRTTGGEAGSPLFDGARETVEALAGQGYLLAIATGKARRGVEHFIRSHGFEGVFCAAQTADDAPSKPHPGMVLNCLAAAKVTPESAVIVGDTEFDMAMGRAAGVRRIGVDWGYHPPDRVLRGGAEALAADFGELTGLIGGLWR